MSESNRTPMWLVPLVLAVLVFVASAVVAVLGWQAIGDSRAEAAQVAALAAARTATAEVLSYDPAHLDADLARSRQLVSGSFAVSFDQLASSVIRPNAQHGTNTQAKVVRAAVIDSPPGQVNALLFVSQTTSSNAQPQPHTSTNQVKVTMTKVGQRWLISDMQPL
jgi:Mce-associated membrane protein